MRRGHRDDVQTGDFAGERVFASRADVRYVLHTATACPDALVVGFSSAQAPGKPPRYRWHKLLRDLPCHRLFVLDDHGPRRPMPGPSWYLGRRRGSDVAGSVCELIERVAEELGVERARTVTIGSSMGGWAALYFGARVGAGHAIAGEPRRGSAVTCADPRSTSSRSTSRAGARRRTARSSTRSSSTPCARPPRLRTRTSTAAGAVPTTRVTSRPCWPC
jgi:pimeloyl-ACP methyl ester carboxylesterase